MTSQGIQTRSSVYNTPATRDDVNRFVRRCTVCPLINHNPKPAPSQHFTLIKARPFQTVYVDSIVNLTGDPDYAHIVAIYPSLPRQGPYRCYLPTISDDIFKSVPSRIYLLG
jgi:hypothetical protein